MSQDTPTTPAPTFTAEQLQRASVAVYIECGPSIAAELSAMLQFAASLVRREEQLITHIGNVAHGKAQTCSEAYHPCLCGCATIIKLLLSVTPAKPTEAP